MVVAGEASGEAHAAALIQSLRQKEPQMSFYGFGGAKMAQAGVELLAEASQINVMGFLEVLPAVGRFLRILGLLKKRLRQDRPQGLIAVDFPEFNLRLIKLAHRLKIPVSYYVTPQVWAWRTGRVKILARCADQLLPILPFEVEFFKARGMEVFFPGHPLADRPAFDPGHAQRFLIQAGLKESRPLIGLLPGSRTNEVKWHLPPMLEAARRLKKIKPELQFVIPIAPGLERLPWPSDLGQIEVAVIKGRAREALAACRAALVCSGTATLEGAWCLTPMVVVYKGTYLSYLIARSIVKGVSRVALPNLIAGRDVVPELIQSAANPAAMAAAILPLIDDGPAREKMVAELIEVKERLGRPGAVKRAADKIAELLVGRAAE